MGEHERLACAQDSEAVSSVPVVLVVASSMVAASARLLVAVLKACWKTRAGEVMSALILPPPSSYAASQSSGTPCEQQDPGK